MVGDSLIGLLLVIFVALALLTPVLAVLFARSAQRHHRKAPPWLKTLVMTLRAINTVVYVSAVAVLLVMVSWLIAHSK